MKKIMLLLSILILATGCKHEEKDNNITGNITLKRYSTEVKDTFSVFIQLPDGYDAKKAGAYPVIYLLDANLYFDIMAVTLKKYSGVGLLEPAILVGIGYKDFRTMDSLRNRDFTFPKAMAEYEMSNSGKGDKFLAFIKTDLVPYMDANYATNQQNRILMGHSLGGYFTLYALQQALIHKENIFSSYIAASPSLEYNRNYLLREFEKMEKEAAGETKVYVTFGGLEDAEEEGETEDPTQLKTEERLSWLVGSLKFNNKIRCRGDLYSNLGHMDTPLPSFVRGLQWGLNMTQ